MKLRNIHPRIFLLGLGLVFELEKEFEFRVES